MTLVVNLIGAPGAGKSTTRAGVFFVLKHLGMNVEEVPEYAKDLTWEERFKTLSCQPYVFGKQYRNVERLLGKVDVIVTDSPIILSAYYARLHPGKYPPSFFQYVSELYDELDSITYFLRRVRKYNPAGRNQTESESDRIAEELWEMLWNSQPAVAFEELDGNVMAVGRIVRDIYTRLGREYPGPGEMVIPL